MGTILAGAAIPSSLGRPPDLHSPPASLRVAAVVSALASGLDLSTGQPEGHSVRTCVIGMRIAQEIGLSCQLKNDLFYALLLKDCGCSANASQTFHALGADDLKAKRDVKTTDWTRTSWETLHYALSHVAPGKPFLERTKALFLLAVNQKAHTKNVTKIRCERGSTLARLMGLSDATANAISNLDEHWDGKGQPEEKVRTEIPILSRIALLAETLEEFLVDQCAQAAVLMANQRSKTWFDPALVKAVNSLAKRGQLWPDVFSDRLGELCLAMEPEPKTIEQGDTTLDNICMAFSNIVDAKSPYTFNHSIGVANAAVAVARGLGMPRERVMFVRHAALLHDLGKLGVSNAILEKPAALNDDEFQSVKQHPFHTWNILRRIPGFEEMSEVAGSHHEKLNGTGYFRGLTGEHLAIESRILAVADIFDALTAKRPYRDGLPLEDVFRLMRKDTPHALDPLCVEVLQQSGMSSDQTYVDLDNLNAQLQATPVY